MNARVAGFIWSTRRAKLKMAMRRRRLAVVIGAGAAATEPAVRGCTRATPESTTPTTMAAMATHIVTADMSIMDMWKCMDAESMNIHRCSTTPAQVRATPDQNSNGRGINEAGGADKVNSSRKAGHRGLQWRGRARWHAALPTGGP